MRLQRNASKSYFLSIILIFILGENQVCNFCILYCFKRQRNFPRDQSPAMHGCLFPFIFSDFVKILLQKTTLIIIFNKYKESEVFRGKNKSAAS